MHKDTITKLEVVSKPSSTSRGFQRKIGFSALGRERKKKQNLSGDLGQKMKLNPKEERGKRIIDDITRWDRPNLGDGDVRGTIFAFANCNCYIWGQVLQRLAGPWIFHTIHNYFSQKHLNESQS